ncbi:MAG TPA: hypothetical protein VHX12_00745, partial [Acidisoma sp.]|nr:hypothetical protein [Acidisoma sp.]
MHLMLVQRQRKHPQSQKSAAGDDQQDDNENEQETTHQLGLPVETAAVLASGLIMRNNQNAPPDATLPVHLADRSIVLVG